MTPTACLRTRRTLVLAAVLTACGMEAEDGAGWGGYADGGTAQCFSSNECPTGWTCSELGRCVAPMAGLGDAGVPTPPEVEREFGLPVHTRRYVYVNMPDLDALAKIDGATLAVSSVPVGDR